MSNILSQRQEIKRLEKEVEKKDVDEREQEERDDELARERAVREFELVQQGLNIKSAKKQDTKPAVEEEPGKVEAKGTKRKFELDEEELLRIAKEERTKYRKELEEEKKTSAHHLPSFWVPSQTPDSSTATSFSHTIIRPPKLTPLCPSSTEAAPHPLSLKTLTPIKFTTELDPVTRAPTPSCPSCRKALSNSSKATIAIPCGHVLCKPCVAKFLKPVTAPDPHHPELAQSILRCFVCEIDLTGEEVKAAGKGDGKEKHKQSKRNKESLKPGLVDLKSEGTGFAGGGGNLVKKDGVSFQC